MFSLFLITFQILLYLSNTSSSLTKKRQVFIMVFKIFYVSTHLRQDNAWFNNFTFFVTTLKSSLWLNLSDITIWSTFSDIKSIGSLDLWNSFLLSVILLNFSVFFTHSVIRKNFKKKLRKKNCLFFNVSFLYWTSSWYFFLWYSLILSFSSCNKFL